ncbi:putative secreted protein [Streptococcus sp. DD10]|uniref:CdaR family protein n=1 Tax=Streptococcus sp. DD10 TaxID=1777878 RepID=UPI0007964ED7|nr:CdaR family protein [Streptococcus sp. DD10]KXT77381.1 putative secreted protein [Streptococcus sp. DD10]
MKRHILYIISATFFALILFVYATTSNFQNSTTSRQVTSETYTNTVTNVPIDLKYDSDKYFISGFSSEVSVDLSGSNRLMLNTEMQETTRNFKVSADLLTVSSGTVEVPLKVENLPSGLTASVKPSKINVTIGKKISKDFTVKSEIKPEQISEDVEIESTTLSQTTVSVTSDNNTIEQIDHVEAVLPDDTTINGNFSGKVSLRAVDANGELLASVISPSEVSLKVVVKSSSSSDSSSSKNDKNKG